MDAGDEWRRKMMPFSPSHTLQNIVSCACTQLGTLLLTGLFHARTHSHTHTHTHTHSNQGQLSSSNFASVGVCALHARVCVCVCVCVRARARARFDWPPSTTRF